MSKWPLKKLREVIGRPISGSRPAGGVNAETEGIPSLGGENVLSEGGITLEKVNRVPFEFYKSMPKGRLEPLDVLINKDGAQTGKVGLYKGDFKDACVNEHLFILRNIDGAINQRFLYYSVLLPDTQAKISRRITGSAQPGLNTTFVDAVEILVPGDILQQRHIAEILSTLDEAIEQTEALIAKMQQVKAGLMHDLFTRGVTPDGRLRPTREQAPELYKESPLGWIPREWEVERLSCFAHFITSGSRGWAEYYSEDGPIFIRIGNLTREHINFRWDNVIRVSPPKSAEGQRTAVMPNDILISITADLGIVAVANKCLGEAYVNQHIALVRPNCGDCMGRFIGHYLTTSAVQKQFIMLNDSGAKAGLNLPTIRNLIVTRPQSEVEAKQIVASVDSCDMAIKAHKRELEQLNYQKHGLMHDLLTGRVRAHKLAEEELMNVPKAISGCHL